MTALLISGSQVRALLGSPELEMIYGRLNSLPFFICDKLGDVVFVDTGTVPMKLLAQSAWHHPSQIAHIDDKVVKPPDRQSVKSVNRFR